MRVRNRMQLRARALREIRALRAAEKAKQQPQQETPLAPCVVRRGAKRQRPATPTEDTGGVSEEAQRAKRGADAASPAPGARCSPLLQAAVSPEDHISETNWLTGTLIDLVLWRLAQLYPAVHFLPTAFYHLHLEGTSRLRRRSNGRDTPAAVAAAADTVNDRYQVRDILGRQVDYTLDTPIVFIVNVGHIHWNLFRVTLSPTAKLQLFEPMGRLASRAGISYRSVPRCVIEWLERCFPQHGDWMARTESAITHAHQVSGFDCGVACLLYADKCGRGHSGEQINAQTNQHAITVFRHQLRAELLADRDKDKDRDSEAGDTSGSEDSMST